jgi:UDP-3-O-[3-hydroxymyristoyl] glucosamine N-acyltransferase
MLKIIILVSWDLSQEEIEDLYKKFNISIDRSVKFGRNVELNKGVTICRDVKIGDNVILGSNVYIGQEAVIGSDVIFRYGYKVQPGVNIANGSIP